VLALPISRPSLAKLISIFDGTMKKSSTCFRSVFSLHSSLPQYSMNSSIWGSCSDVEPRRLLRPSPKLVTRASRFMCPRWRNGILYPILTVHYGHQMWLTHWFNNGYLLDGTILLKYRRTSLLRRFSWHSSSCLIIQLTIVWAICRCSNCRGSNILT